MKIYSKRNFISGILLTSLGILLLILNIIIEFRVKSCIISALCLYFGIGSIIRSMSRELTKEDMLNELDERNQLINLKSRSKSFGLTQTINFVLMLLFFIAAKVIDDEMLVYVGVGLSFSFTISIIVEFCTTIYYEHQN